MKKYINTSNYYLSTIASTIPNSTTEGTFDVADVSVDWVILPTEWYYWVDVDFGDVSKREIFRITKREWYTLFYDARISPYGKKVHSIWATVWLRDFSQLLNSLSTNTDNFWEVEKIDWQPLKVLVRKGNIFASGAADVVVEVPNKILEIPASSETYIVLDFTDELWLQAAEFTTAESLSATGIYPIAKVTTNSTTITNIEDLRSTMIWWGWEWDMKWEVWKDKYLGTDKTKEWNVFDMDVMEQWNNNLYVSPSQVTTWTWKQDELVSWQNIVTINGKSIIDVSQWEDGNVSLDTILTVGWKCFTTDDWAEGFPFPEWYYPLSDEAFIVFTDSGTMMVLDVDYTYDDTNHIITFTNQLASNEHAYVWVMYNNSTSSSQIWSGTITMKYWENTKTFNVNQDESETIDLEEDLWIWDIANDSTITFTQWGKADQTITTNQSNDKTISFQWTIPVTQDEYNELPDSKTTDGNWYFIYEE